VYAPSVQDPYDANKGLYHSHMGWIFRKPSYPRMQSVERKDLDADPGPCHFLLPTFLMLIPRAAIVVVRFQHKYYLPLTLGLGLVAPTLIGATYGDAMGGYIWGGVSLASLSRDTRLVLMTMYGHVARRAYPHLALYVLHQLSRSLPRRPGVLGGRHCPRQLREYHPSSSMDSL
jgi:stearoyl-CoA desaturase (delta-9 desaturase)